MYSHFIAKATGARARVLAAAGLCALLGSCVLAPSGLKREQVRAHAAGGQFEPPFDQRTLPEIPERPEWRDVLHRALLADGELEASYFEWRAALSRVEVQSTYPNTNLALGFSVMLSRERMKLFDRGTVSAAPDGMANLSLPSKVRRRGEVALDEAQAAGERFRAKKFEVQSGVMTAWVDYALIAERQRIAAEKMELIRQSGAAAANGIAGGAASDELLRTEIAMRNVENERGNLKAEAGALQARINGLLAREPLAALAAPSELTEPRALPLDDARLIAVAAERNPELRELAAQVQERKDALEVARLQWLPDINPNLSLTGTASQALGAMVILPTTMPAIRSSIEEAEALGRAAEAALRQAQQNRGAMFVATLIEVHNNERQREFLEKQIRPVAESIAEAGRRNYALGGTQYGTLIEDQQALLEVRGAIAEARAAREKSVIELEALMGTDLETLGAGHAEDGASTVTVTLGRGGNGDVR